MANKKIQTTELDFDGIKTNLKTYLQGQSEFSDYDFEGSGLSVLLDVLAYNTHYNALYTNLAINEAFIDSASKRSNVVSKAKELGYNPRSSTAATAIVAVSIINDQLSAPDLLEIPAFTPFNAQVEGKTYTFYTDGSYTAQKNGNIYVFPNVEIKEGAFYTYTYTYEDQNTPIIIPNANVDTSSIKVFVQENSQSSNIEVFNKSDTILNVRPIDPVYFLKEIDDERYQIEFGNDIVGKSLEAGNLVVVNYKICNAGLPNGARSFTYSGPLSNQNQIYTTTITAAFGGSGPETIESIRWNAPRAYATQNRCITVDDYKSIVSQLYLDARSVAVWGGEDVTPKQYGKVFISIIKSTNTTLTDGDKEFVLNNIIKPRKPLTVTTEIVDPSIIDIRLKTSVYVDPNGSNRSFSDIETIVRDTIISYNNNTLNLFGAVFKHSQLSSLIDDADPGISSNITRIQLYRDITPIFNVGVRYEVFLNNPIYKSVVPEENVLSTPFLSTESERPCFIEDVPNKDSNIGTLRLFFRNEQTGEKVFIRNVGTVNYTTGNIIVEKITITGYVGPSFGFVINPASPDVVPSLNQFVRIDIASLQVNALNNRQFNQYPFTPTKF